MNQRIAMYLMHILHSSENYIEQLSLKHKILFFLLPILIFGYLDYYLDSNKSFQSKKTEINIDYHNIEKRLTPNNIEEKLVAFLKKCENFTSKNGLVLTKTKIEHKRLSFSATSNMHRLLTFMYFIEKNSAYSLIAAFSLNQHKKGEYTLTVEVDFSNYWIKELPPFISLKKEKNQLFKKIAESTKTLLEEPQFSLQAIVGEYTYMNNLWLKERDTLLGFMVIKIAPNYVQLQKENRVIRINLRKESDVK